MQKLSSNSRNKTFYSGGLAQNIQITPKLNNTQADQFAMLEGPGHVSRTMELRLQKDYQQSITHQQLQEKKLLPVLNKTPKNNNSAPGNVSQNDYVQLAAATTGGRRAHNHFKNYSYQQKPQAWPAQRNTGQSSQHRHSYDYQLQNQQS